MPQGKRKRSGDKVYAFFPDETWHGGKKSVAEPVLEPLSLTRAWKRCGDGFDSSRAPEAHRSSESKFQAARRLAPSFISVEETSVVGNSKEPADIVWSSSDSDVSNEESKEFLSPADSIGRYSQNTGKCHHTNNSVPAQGGSGGDIPEIIDWQNDSDFECDEERCSESEAAESAVEISDSESSLSNITVSQLQNETEPSKAVAMEIAEYSSDDPLDDATMPAGWPTLPISDEGEVVGKSASEWVRSAQALLQTPEKKADKASKTPEDSAKKRKKFLRGGLAERLSHLQNRERSAISFWRHQCESDRKMPLGVKSGVLMLKIIEVHEECSMQVAVCQQLTNFPNAGTSSTSDSDAAATLKVLFTRQTAAHLKGGQHDIIHIHPPWQTLTLRNENLSVILNTHFSQKVILSQNEEATKRTYCPEISTARRKPVSLAWIFKISDAGLKCQPECVVKQQVSSTNTAIRKTLLACNSQGKQCASCFTMDDSLLDVVETQGAAGWKGACIRVVIQRVYCLPSRDSSGSLLQGSSKTVHTPVINSERSDVRLCLLIQDIYGMFSELHLQSANSCADDLEQYSKRWEGKACRLSGMKILQRTTRGRAPGLFSLIDSVWPPLVPIKVHGQSQGQGQIQTNLSAPSFCYILAVHHDEGCEGIREEAETSDLYLPPVVHSLGEILQAVGLSQRCSFWATVIYLRPQQMHGVLALQQEMWIFVTDTTLQADTASAPTRPRVLSVCVSPSCVLDSRVLQALCKKAPCAIYFKDAVRENGRIICVERTVLLLQKPLLSYAPGVNKLTGPVRLDELDSTTPANSICTVKGTVVGVNERTAFSWPECNQCGSSKLQCSIPDRGSFFCSHCSQVVSCPVVKMQLEVFLHCELRPGHTVKVKLQQETISFLLRFSSSENGSYEVSGVMGKEVGPLNCYVQSVTSHPNSSVVLEEVCVLEAAMLNGVSAV